MISSRELDNHCPCKGCQDRTVEPNCHTMCSRYNAWKIVQDAQKLAQEPERMAKTYRHENYVKVLSKKHK